MTKKLLLVCDDAGFASVQRGILSLIERTGKPICAEFLIETDGAIQRAKELSHDPLASIGIHFEVSGITDADRVAMAKELKEKGTTLGEQRDIQRKAANDARRQLTVFRDALGKDPAHISTHGDFNLDASGAVMPWWLELMEELFPKHVPPMQWKIPHVRHNKYSWNLPETKRNAMTPEEFGKQLEQQTSDVIEFVMHPALPETVDASLDMLFSAAMRIRDLEAAIEIINSGSIERSGFAITPVSALRA